MWIDRKLAAGAGSDGTRRQLEKLRAKALSGELADDEFERVRAGARRETNPLGSLVCSLRTARRRAKAVSSLPPTILSEIDALIARIAALADATKQVAMIVRRGGAARRSSVIV